MLHSKKIISALLVIAVHPSLYTMNLHTIDSPNTKPHVIYLHGFGENKHNNSRNLLMTDILTTAERPTSSVPEFPDAPAMIEKAVFYTQPAVSTAADEIYDQVITQKKDRIIILGLSCGAGTGIKLLAALADYNNNQQYFRDSKIQKKEDAEAIIKAINNGAFIATAPFLGLKKANAIAIPSTILTGLTFAALTGAGCYYSARHSDNIDPNLSALSVLSIGYLAYCALADHVKSKIYSNAIIRFIVPRITNFHFNPKEADPLDSITPKLRETFTCPMLLHFYNKDGVLENPDNDTIKAFEGLQAKENNTHIIITEDGWHNGLSRNISLAIKTFLSHYRLINNLEPSEKITIKYMSPTLKELKNKIYPSSGLFYFLTCKKYALTLTGLLASIFLMRCLTAGR